MAKHLNISLDFNANTKKAEANIRSLQQSLQTIGRVQPAAGTKLNKDLQQAVNSARSLETHLTKAFNTKTGNIDLKKLNKSLKQSGQNLSDLSGGLLKAGASGQKAFIDMQNAIATSNVQLTKSQTLLKEFGTVMKNTVRWQISSSVLHGFMSTMSQAYGYAKNLDRSLNNIRIVSGANTEEMARFAKEANKAAKALNTTTTKYTDASLIYYQQGLSDEEVKKRTEVTMKMANVSRDSAEVVSDQMTAIWNNFDNGTQTLEYYADVMAALGAATASSTAEIAQGLEKFAAIADTVGLSYEYSTAALATVTATTRQSADVVGTAFKTMFARIQGLKLGETLEDGTTLNKYSEALDAVGVKIKDANGEIKNMDTILDEMASKWKEIKPDERIALAQTVAGVRQYTQLVALMDNWDFMEENLQTVANAEGSLNEQAETYAESWEAARDRLRAAFEEIYTAMIPSDTMIGITDFATGVVEQIANIVNALGGLKGILLIVSSIAMKKFSGQITESLTKVGSGVKELYQNKGKSKYSDPKEMYEKYKTQGKDYASQSKFFEDNFSGEGQASKELQIAQSMNVKKNYDNSMSQAGREYLTTMTQVNNMQGMIEASRDKMTASEADSLSIQQQKVILLAQEKNELDNIAEAKEQKLNDLVESSYADYITDERFDEKTKDDRIKFTLFSSESTGKNSPIQNMRDEFLKVKKEAEKLGIGLNIDNPVLSKRADGKTDFKLIGSSATDFQDLEKALKSRYSKLAEIKKKYYNLATTNDITEEGAKELKEYGFDFNKSNNIEDVKNLREQILQSISQSKQFAKTYQIDPKELQDITDAVGELIVAQRNQAGSIEAVGAAMKSVDEEYAAFQARLNSTTQKVVESTQALTEMGIGFSSIIGVFGDIKDTFNGDMEIDELFTGLIAQLPFVLSGFSTLTKQFDKAAFGAAKLSLKSGKIFKGFGSLLGGISLTGKIGIAIAGVTALIKLWKSHQQKVENTANSVDNINGRINALKERLSEANNEFNELNTGVSDLESLYGDLNNLTKGTEDWRDKLNEVNQEVLQLLETFPQLEPFITIGENGEYRISKDGIDGLKEDKRQEIQDLTTSKLIAEGAKSELEIQEAKLNAEDTIEKYFMGAFTGDMYHASGSYGMIEQTAKGWIDKYLLNPELSDLEAADEISRRTGIEIGEAALGVQAFRKDFNYQNNKNIELAYASEHGLEGRSGDIVSKLIIKSDAFKQKKDESLKKQEKIDNSKLQEDFIKDNFSEEQRKRGVRIEDNGEVYLKNKDDEEELQDITFSADQQREINANREAIENTSVSDALQNMSDAVKTLFQGAVQTNFASENLLVSGRGLSSGTEGELSLGLASMLNEEGKIEEIDISQLLSGLSTQAFKELTEGENSVFKTDDKGNFNEIDFDALKEIIHIDLKDLLANDKADIVGNKSDFTGQEFEQEQNVQEDTLAEQEGFDLEEFQVYRDTLAEVNDELKDNAIKANAVALKNKKMQRGLKSINDNWQDWNKELTTSNENSPEYIEALNGATQALEDMLNVPIGSLSKDFLKNKKNLELFNKAIEGSSDAINELQANALNDYLSNLGISEEKLTDLQEAITDVASADIKVGEVVQEGNPLAKQLTDIYMAAVDAAYQGSGNLTAAMQAGAAAIEQTGFGVPEMEVREIDVTSQIPDGWTPQPDGSVVTGTDPNGNPILAQGIHAVVSESGETTYKQTMLVPKNYQFPKTNESFGGGGGSKGGGGGSKKKPEKKKESDKERYHTVNNQIQDLSAEYDDLSKAKDRAFGKDRIKNIDKEIQKTGELIDKNKELLKEVKKNESLDKTNFVNEFNKVIGGVEIKFDNMNNIANFDEIQDRMFEVYNSNADNMGEDAFNEFKEDYDMVEKLLGLFEETHDLAIETQQGITDLVNQAEDLALGKIQTEVELKINISDDSLALLEFQLDKIGEDTDKTAESIALLGQKTGEVFQKIEANKKGLKDILKEQFSEEDFEAFLNGDNSKFDSSKFTDEEISAIKSYRDEILSLNKELLDISDAVRDKVSKAFEGLTNNFEKVSDKIEHSKNVLESYKEIVSLIGKDRFGINDEIISALNSAKLASGLTSLKNDKSNYEALLKARADAQSKIFDNISAEEKAKWQEVIDDINSSIDEAEEKFLESWQNALTAAEEIFDSTIENLVDKFEKTLFKAGGFEDFESRFEKEKELADMYVEDYDKVYSLNKLNRQIDKSLKDDKIIGDKSKLRDLQKQILKMQEKGVKLSEYDLNYAQKMYELRLAEIALEDAQNAKSIVRMSRDNEGHWGYVYTNDLDELEEAKQKYEDVLKEMQDASHEEIENIQNDIKDLFGSTAEEMRGVDKTKYSTQEEYMEKITQIQENALGKMKVLQDKLKNALKNNDELYVEWEKYAKKNGFEIPDKSEFETSFADTLLSEMLGIDNIDDVMTNFQEALGDKNSGLTKEFLDAFAKWQEDTKDILDNANRNPDKTPGESILGDINDVKQETDKIDASIKNMSDNAVSNFNDMLDSVKFWRESYQKNIDLAIEKNLQLIETFNKLIEVLSSDGLKLPDGFGQNLKDVPAVYSRSSNTPATMSISMSDDFNGNFKNNYFEEINGILSSINHQINILAKINQSDIRVPQVQVGNTSQQKEELQQYVNITAEFKDSTTSDEIQTALLNLTNTASQYANRGVV